MKKIVNFLVLIFIFGTNWAQVTTSSDQLFGGTRNFDNNTFDFQTITKTQEHEFFISNSNKVPVSLKSIDVPDGFTVTIVDKVLNPQTIGKVIVAVNPKLFKNKGFFEQQIKILAEYEIGNDKNIKEYIFTVKGYIQ